MGVSYTYSSDGTRLTKTVNGVQTSYTWDGAQLVSQKTGNEAIYFLYHGSSRVGLEYQGSTYYYLYNLQGDVVGLVDSNGNTVVSYTYDAWGHPESITGSMASTLGAANPFRYRSYYFDTESGLYYLMSRYYDPVVGRWINADSVIAGVGGSVQGNNAFTYCFNNPINMVDSTGHWPKWIEDAADWVNDKIIDPVKGFVGDIVEDCKNYDKNNTSETKVLDSHYFSSYKGVPVIRIDGNRSGSFGAIFLTRETNSRSNPADVLRHEYGHTKQLEQLGIINYALCIGLPSWQEWGSGDYYSKPWEITADIYGGVQSRKHTKDKAEAGATFLAASKLVGLLAWFLIK